MSPFRFTIREHLIIPFGTKRNDGRLIKDLSHIKLAAVSTSGIAFESDLPVVYVDKSTKKPLRIAEADQALRLDTFDKGATKAEVIETLDEVQNALFAVYDGTKRTKYETLFLELYFRRLKQYAQTPYVTEENALRVFNALLPLPEAQFHVRDPLNDREWPDPTPKNNVRIDFAFWTGRGVTAVELDGAEPGGYARDVMRDRMLRRANIDVIHILNTELEQHQERTIDCLLPSTVSSDWRFSEPPKFNPLGIPF